MRRKAPPLKRRATPAAKNSSLLDGEHNREQTGDSLRPAVRIGPRQETCVPKLTLGASRSAAAVISKNSRSLNPHRPATMLPGI